MASTTRNIIQEAVKESRFKERRIQTYNEIALKCKRRMGKQFKGTWSCQIGAVAQYGCSYDNIAGTLFIGRIDGLRVILYKSK